MSTNSLAREFVSGEGADADEPTQIRELPVTSGSDQLPPDPWTGFLAPGLSLAGEAFLTVSTVFDLPTTVATVPVEKASAFSEVSSTPLGFVWHTSCFLIICGRRINKMTQRFIAPAGNDPDANQRSYCSYRRPFAETLIVRDQCSGNMRVHRICALLATMAVALFLATPGFGQEQRHPYSEYTYWFGGTFENGHAFSSTVGARNYQLETRYERLIYWNQPFAVRWVFDLVPVALVGDRYTSSGRRAYSYGIGGSPVGAQVNFVHFRHVEPFLTSGGGFLYFNHRMFGTTQQFNFTAQLGGGVQLFTSSRHTAVDLGYKYHHISNANLANQNPGLDSHMVFIGISLFR